MIALITQSLIKRKFDSVSFGLHHSVFGWSTCGDLPRFIPIAHIEFRNVLRAYITRIYINVRAHARVHVYACAVQEQEQETYIATICYNRICSSKTELQNREIIYTLLLIGLLAMQADCAFLKIFCRNNSKSILTVIFFTICSII